jgi:VWFA-related protein
MMNTRKFRRSLTIAVVSLLLLGPSAIGQDGTREGRGRGPAKPVTIPVTVRLRDSKPVEMRFVDYILREDGELQTILSSRIPQESPMTLALLIQDDLVSSIANETKGLIEFIKHQPGGSRVMVGYIHTGTLEVRRKFTNELDKAAASIRPPQGLASASPFNPYVEVIEALRRFDSQPMGRRAIILISDGIDLSRGPDSASPAQSLDLRRAISEAQRRGVAIYSIFAPANAAPGAQFLNSIGQSCLEVLSNETGGKAFFQGTGAPVSFDPFLREIDESLGRQIALTYLSTHTNKGFHKLDIKPLERDVEIRHPAGYPR